jgi:hypothetical protein
MKLNLGNEQTTLHDFFSSQPKKGETRPQGSYITTTTSVSRKAKQGGSTRKSSTKSPQPDEDEGPPSKRPKMTGQLSPPSSSYDQPNVRNQAGSSKGLETPRQGSHSTAWINKTSDKAASGKTPSTITRRRLRTAALVLPTPPATTDKKHNQRNKRSRSSMFRSPSSDDSRDQPSSSYLPTASKLRSPVRGSPTRRALQFSPSTPQNMRLKSTVKPFAPVSPKFVPSSQTPERYGIATRSPTISPHSGGVANRPRTVSNASSSSLSSVPSDIGTPSSKHSHVVLAPDSESPKKGKENKTSPSKSRVALSFKHIDLVSTEVIEDSQSSPLLSRAHALASVLSKTPQGKREALLVPNSKSHKKASELLADVEGDDEEEDIPDSPSLRAGQIHLPIMHASPVFKVPQPISGPLRFPIEKPSRNEPSTSTSAVADLSPRHNVEDAEKHAPNVDDYIPSSQTQLELVPASPIKPKRFHRPDIHPHQPHDPSKDDHKHEFVPSSQSQIEKEISFAAMHHSPNEGAEKVTGDSRDSR